VNVILPNAISNQEGSPRRRLSEPSFLQIADQADVRSETRSKLKKLQSEPIFVALKEVVESPPTPPNEEVSFEECEEVQGATSPDSGRSSPALSLNSSVPVSDNQSEPEADLGTPERAVSALTYVHSPFLDALERLSDDIAAAASNAVKE